MSIITSATLGIILKGSHHRAHKKNINLQILSGLAVPIASPDRQLAVATKLDHLEQSVHQLMSQQLSVRDECGLLMPSIVNRAFAGQV